MAISEATRKYRTGWQREKYRNDPVYREKCQSACREQYQKNREKRLAYATLYAKLPEVIVRRNERDKVARTDPAKLLRRLITHAAERARKKGLEFDKNACASLSLPVECPLLKMPLFLGRRNGVRNALSPSLDRIDSSKGYVAGNVRIVSWWVN